MKCFFLLNCLSVPYLGLRFLQHFLGACPGLWRWWFVTSLVTRCIPRPPREVILPGTNGQLDPEEGLVIPGSGVKALDAQLNWWGAGTREGRRAPPVGLVRTWIQIIGLPLEGRRGDRSPPRELWVTLSRVKLGLSGLGSQTKICETPLGIGKVEHLPDFLTNKIDRDEKQHK
jgi:hypothetical protein